MISPARARGLTLLELLLALTLFALLALVLHASLRTTASVWRSVDAAAQRSEDRFVVEQFVRRTLEQAAPVAAERRTPRVLLFEGEPGAIEFATTLAGHLGVPGMYRVRFEIVDGADGRALQVRYWLLRDGDDDAVLRSAAVTKTLIGALDAAGFAYYGAPRGASAGAWVDEWRAEPALPQVVRVTLRDHAGSAAVWSIPLRSQTLRGKAG